MRIGLVSYPMLFQRDAGVQLQIRETTRALHALRELDGVALEIELVDPSHAALERYDLVHVFSASGGNHRLIEAAAEMGIPVVLSPLISPGWDRACGEHARQAGHGAGVPTAWSAHGSYAQTSRALQLASLVLAVGAGEKNAIEEGFLVDSARVKVFPSGVCSGLFEADGELFRQRTGMRGPFVLMCGDISPYQDQLGMAQALAGSALAFVLLGDTRERDQEYLRQVRAARGVTCLGGLHNDPRMLASAYAAAAVVVLPCEGEACMRTVFDALAVGTPVVLGAARRIELPDSGFALQQVAWDDALAQQSAVLRLIAAPPPRERVRALVRPFTWERAARRVAASYLMLGAGREALSA